jgi:MFS family permease
MRWPWLSGRFVSAGGADLLAGYRNVVAVVAGLTVLQAAMTSLSIVVALNLKAAGASNAALGLVASCFSGGLLLGALVSPAEIARIGHIRAYALFAAIGSIGALSLSLANDLAIWAFIQAIMGLTAAGLLTSGESWVSDAAPSHQRGSILAFYHMVSRLGAIAGPFLVAGLSLGAGGFMMVAALFVLSLVPVTVTQRSQPVFAAATPYGPRKLLKLAPAAAIAAFMSGLVNNAVAQLYPIFASDFAPGNQATFSAQFNAAVLAGALLGLWPAGLISDRIDRRLVIATLSVIGSVSAIALFLAAGAEWRAGVILSAFCFGIGAQSYYAIAIAHAADRADPDQITSMMAGILMIWGLGSVIGPILAGLVMNTRLGGEGLFVFASVSLALLAVSVFIRAVGSGAVDAADKEAFGASPATSYAIAEFDPRGIDEQLDLFSDYDAPDPETLDSAAETAVKS